MRAGEPDDVEPRERIVDVLACNWDAVQVYPHCQQTLVGGGDRIVHGGIAASECRAAVAMLRIPRSRWPDILDGVQTLGQLVASELNRRAR